MLIAEDIQALEEKLQSVRGTISAEEYESIAKRIEEIKSQGIDLPANGSAMAAIPVIAQIVDLEFNKFSKEFMDEAAKKSKKEAFLQKLQYITSCIEKNDDVSKVIEAAETYWNSIEKYYEDIEKKDVREKIDEIKLEATLSKIKHLGKLDAQAINLKQNYFLIREKLQHLLTTPDISEEDKLLINSWLGESIDIESGEINDKAMEEILKESKLWALLSGVKEEKLQTVNKEYKSEKEEVVEDESEERKREIEALCAKYGISETQLREALEASGDNVYIVKTLFGHKIVLEQERINKIKKNNNYKKNQDVRAIIYNNNVEFVENQIGNAYIDPETIVFSDNTVAIGERAFAYKSKLKSIRLPQKRLRDIGDNAFECSALSELTIPDCVESIGSRAFEDTQLKSICFGTSLKRIGRCAFMLCSLEEIDIPGNVEEIEEFAFANNPLRTLTLHDGLKVIGKEAFSDSQLTSVLLPMTVKETGRNIVPEYTKIQQVKKEKRIDRDVSEKSGMTLAELEKERAKLVAELSKIDEKIRDEKRSKDTISIEK